MTLQEDLIRNWNKQPEKISDGNFSHITIFQIKTNIFLHNLITPK